MIKVPYIRINQKSEVFYVTRFRSDILLPFVDFHFREPYSDLNAIDVRTETNIYLDKIRSKGIEFHSSEEGIQRRLQYDRIKNIAHFLSTEESNFIPNSILLSASTEGMDSLNDILNNDEANDVGYFEFPDSIRFNVIDGQHRLAGIHLLDEEFQKTIELTVVLLFNISVPTAAKLFSDINGKQKPVNKSLIYDLYDQIGKEYKNSITKFHSICEAFYSSKTSPLYRQIKMLGTGTGAISQAFFIDYTYDAINKIKELIESDVQTIYEQLFYYFRAFQKTFPQDWPVPIEFKTQSEVETHANFVLKQRKSQLAKTNGFGAIIKSFPAMYKRCDGDFKLYENLVAKLKGKIDWLSNESTGTGKAFQNKLTKEISSILDLDKFDSKSLATINESDSWDEILRRSDIVKLNEFQFVPFSHPDLKHVTSVMWDGENLRITNVDNPDIVFEKTVDVRNNKYLVVNPHFNQKRWVFKIKIINGKIELQQIRGLTTHIALYDNQSS